jgi:hypothetical protein
MILEPEALRLIDGHYAETDRIIARCHLLKHRGYLTKALGDHQKPHLPQAQKSGIIKREKEGGKAMKQLGFFSEEKALERLSKLGDPLEQLEEIMDWEIFMPIMNEIRPDKTQEGVGGRPPFTNLFVIKSLILKEMNGVSNANMEFYANDRLTWKRFLGLSLEEKAPDENTFQSWEDQVAKSGHAKELFEIFNQKLEEKGIIYCLTA